MGKRGLDRFSDELELKYSNGNKRARYSEICLSKDGAKVWKEDSLKIKPYVYVKPLEESLAIQAYKEGNTINLADYPETSSFTVAILSSKKPTKQSILICRKAARELQFLKYLEKLGWKSDLITEYCRTSQTDINTLMKELKVLYFSLKECNVNVDKIIEQCSKDQRNVKLFFEYLTKYLQSISTRKPVIVLERIDPKLNLSQNKLKRKMQEILIPDQNKVGKVNIETVDDTAYQEIKKPNLKKSCTRIREDLSVNKPFVAPYNFQQDKSSLTPGGKRLGKSLDSQGEVESCTDKEELPIRSKVSERPVDNYYQSSILKPDERNKQIPRRKLTPQDAPDDTNYDAETDTIESTDSLKESETKINAGIEENVLSKSNEQVSTVSSRLSKRDTRKRKVIEKNWNLQSKSKSTSTGKQIVIPTNDSSSIEEETVNELGDSSRNDERMDASTKKHEPLISSEKIYRKRNGLRKRSTRGTKSIESDNDNGMADAKCALPVKEKNSKNSLAVDCTVNDGKQSESTVDKDNSTEDCGKNGVNTNKQDLKEIETEDSFILTENDSSIQKLEDSLKQTQVTKETLETENVSLINSEECVRFDAGNENKDDAASDKDMDSGSRDSAVILKSGTENKNLVNTFQASKDDENEMDQSIDIKSDKNTIVLRDSLESVLEERTNINDTKETIDSTDVDEVRLSENESLRHTSNRKKEVSLIKNDSKNKNEINKIAKGLKQMELSSDEVSSTSRYNEESEQSHVGEQVLEECAASLSNIVSSQEVDKSTNLIKKIDIVLKPLTVRLNLLTSYIDEHGKRIDMTGREKFFKAPDHSKADECTESANKYKEAKDLQEEKIYFENSETSQHNSESKSSNLGEQVLEECAASLSNIVSLQDVDMSTNSTKETDISPKHVTVKLNSLTSHLDEHGKDIEMTGREMFSRAPDLSKTDECIKSAIKYKEIKDLQEKIINFEISETLQHNEENKSSNLGEQILEECSANLSKNSDGGTESANQYKETNGLLENIMNLENSEILQNNAESKSSHLPEQILEECSDSLSRKSDECTASAKLYKEIKGLQEKIIHFEINETSQHNTESKSSNLEEQILEECSASLSTKSDDCNESANKYKETKDLEEKMEVFENSETMQDNAESKSYHLEDQIVEECAASLSNITSSQQVDMSANLLKETNIVLKPLTVRLNLLKSFSDNHEKNIEMNARERVLKVSDCRKADESIESTNKYEETKDLQERMINFEYSEKTKSDDKKQHGDVEIAKELPISHHSQCEKTIENASYGFNSPLSFQNFSTGSNKNIRDCDAKKESESNKEDSNVKDSSSIRIETNKRSTVVKKRSFDIESLIAIDEPKEQCSLIGEKQFERNSAEARYFSTMESTDSLRESTPIKKYVPISQHEIRSVEEQTTNKVSPINEESEVAIVKKREQLISSDSAESSRLRNRVARKTKEVERNITSTLDLDSKSEHSTAGKEITIPTNDTCCIDEEVVSESGDSSRKDAIMQAGNKNLEPLLSNASAESSRLRKRATRKTKDVGKNTMSTLNLDSKSEPPPTGKQITITSYDFCSIEKEQLVSESGDSPRKDQILEACPNEREPLIISDCLEKSQLRKRASRKTKDVDKNIASTLNLESQSEPTHAEKQITILTNDTCSVEEDLVSKSEYPYKNEEIIDINTKKPEPLIHNDSVESSRLRKRVTRKTKDIERNIESTLNLDSKSEPTQAGKQITIPTDDPCSVVEEQVSGSCNSFIIDEIMEVDNKKREPLISTNSTESSRLRNRTTRKTKGVEKNITSTLNLDSKSEPPSPGKLITVPSNDFSSNEEEKLVSESGDHSRKDEIMDVSTKKQEPLMPSDSVESSRLRKRATRKTKDLERHIAPTLNLDSKSEPTPAGRHIKIPSSDFCSIEEEQLVSESGDPSKKDEMVEVCQNEQEPLIRDDSVEKSRLRKRATRKTKNVEKNITSPSNLQPKSQQAQAGKQITIPSSDSSFIEEEQLVSELGDPHKDDVIMGVSKKKLELLIPSNSVESSRLRKRASRKTKDAERNFTSTLNLDPKSEPTPAGKRITVPTNDSCPIEGELVSEPRDSSRKDQIMEVGTKEREQSSDRAENSRLRKRVTRKTKSAERNIMPTLNLEPKSQPTEAGKQITVPTNDFCSIEEEQVSKSGDLSRNDEIMEADTNEPEPLISSERVECRRLRKRATRKTKSVEEIITSTLNIGSKGEPTPARKQTAMPTNDTCSTKEELVSESGDPSRKDEIMEVGTKEQELSASCERAESSRLRKRTTRNTKVVEKNLFPLNFESKGKSTPTTKQLSKGTNDISSIEDEKDIELGDLSRNDERMDSFTKKIEPLVNSNKVYTKRDGLRKRNTRGTKVVASENDNSTALSLNSDRTRKQPEREKVLDISPDIDVNLGDDISESTKLDENNGEKSPNLSNNTKSEINDEFKRRLVVDISVSEKTESERINECLGILIEDGSTLQINERKDKQLVYRVSRNQTQSTTEVDKSKSSKRNSNNLDISRKDENGAIRDLRNYEEEGTKDDESERLKRDKKGVKVQSEGCDPIKDLRNQQLEGDSKSLENGLSKTNEIKLLNIRINVRDVAEDLRKQAEENLKRSKEKESSDNEISQIWCFSTKDTERRSFEDIDSEMFSVDSQMPSSLYLRLESMDLNKSPVEKATPCPDFKANGNSILYPYDTFQDADFSWQCYKLQASTAESPRSMGSNPLLSENGDVLQMLKIDDDIESQIFGLNTGDVLQMLRIDDDIETPTFGLNTGLPSLYPIQSTSSAMNPRKIF